MGPIFGEATQRHNTIFAQRRSRDRTGINQCQKLSKESTSFFQKIFLVNPREERGNFDILSEVDAGKVLLT